MRKKKQLWKSQSFDPWTWLNHVHFPEEKPEVCLFQSQCLGQILSVSFRNKLSSLSSFPVPFRVVIASKINVLCLWRWLWAENIWFIPQASAELSSVLDVAPHSLWHLQYTFFFAHFMSIHQLFSNFFLFHFRWIDKKVEKCLSIWCVIYLCKWFYKCIYVLFIRSLLQSVYSS